MTTKSWAGRRSPLPTRPPSRATPMWWGKRREGPLADSFDQINQDDSFGKRPGRRRRPPCRSWPSPSRAGQGGAERLRPGLYSGRRPAQPVHWLRLRRRGQDVPFFGLYGACSTMAESLSLAALLLDGGFATHAAAITSPTSAPLSSSTAHPWSTAASAPTAQWTVTGAGCVILSREGRAPISPM